MRKKHKKHARRRRMSGVGAVGGFTPEIGAALGGVAGGLLNKVMPSTVNPKLVAGGKIVLGVLAGKAGKTEIVKGMGLGLVALGTVEMLQQFGVLNGIGAPASSDMMAVSLEGTESVLAGAEDLSVINGSEDLSVINGTDDINGTESVLAGTEDYMGASDIESF